MRYYERVANYAQQNDPLLPPVGPSFRAIDTCNGTLTNPLPQNVSTAPLPCSLNDTSGVTNVADPLNVYRMLDQGISQINSSFNLINFTFLDNAEFNGQSTPIQIVTTLQDGISHALFFNPNAAEDYDLTDFGLGPDYGIDYVANTTSMNTRCTMATKDCGIAAIKPGSIDINQNNISIPFHCYDEFSGNLGQTPATGHERAQGWNMSFYNVIHDSPQNIPVQAQSNPFNFYVAAAVNSINFQDLQDAGTPEADPKNGSLVDVGGGFSAFALNCSATVYDVKFSLVNGSFSLFSATKAPPQKASIIKAPLQVGFGQYRLYQAAQIAVLPNDKSIADTMSTAFSQTGMALASGAFDFDDNAIMRRRWTVNVTKVPKAPFWFLVIVCLIYSVFGIVMTIAAFLLRRTPEIRDQQARLMVEWGPELQKMSDDKVKEQKEREKSRSSDSGLLSFVMS